MVVVVVIGLLAAIAIPSYLKSSTRSQATTIANDFRVYSSAFQIRATELGTWPEDVNRGVIPPEMQGHLPKFDQPSILGGAWDWDKGSVGYKAAVSLVDANISGSLAQKIDKVIDDGNPSTGNLVVNGTRIIYILEE